MIDATVAEAALDFLRESAKEMELLVSDAERAEYNVKAVEAELEKQFHQEGIPVSVCKSYARAEKAWKDAAENRSRAAGVLRGLESRRDAAKNLTMVYMSQVKDRM